MPFVDLWFDVKEGAYNYVAPFITSLKWAGGAVGVRSSSGAGVDYQDLRKLAGAYRAARAPVKALPKNGHAWPVDIIDYWLGNPADLRRVSAYRLDPAKGPLAVKKDVTLQDLAAGATQVEISHLRKLIRVDFVAAQRGLGAEEDEAKSETANSRPGLFSSQLLKFARQHLNVSTSSYGNGEELIAAIAKAQS